ncbi:MAG: hypothetical protein JWO58_2973 [Chitinophagaceae bacterium]|nr:hypothetical protein [Chitinophagaceae bacterium]
MGSTSIKSGFDVEFLLSSIGAQTLVQQLYDQRTIPSSIQIPLNNAVSHVNIGRPQTVTIIDDHTRPAVDLEVSVPVLDQTLLIILCLGLKQDPNNNNLTLTLLDIKNIRSNPPVLAIKNLIINSFNAYTQNAMKSLSTVLTSTLDDFKIKKLSATGDFQLAFGFYVNLKLNRVDPVTHHSPDRNSHVANAVNFLPPTESFVIGIPPSIFPELQSHVLNTLGTYNSDMQKYTLQSGDRTLDINQLVITTGTYTSKTQSLLLIPNFDVEIDGLPDPTVQAIIQLMPVISNGQLTFSYPAVIATTANVLSPLVIGKVKDGITDLLKKYIPTLNADINKFKLGSSFIIDRFRSQQFYLSNVYHNIILNQNGLYISGELKFSADAPVPYYPSFTVTLQPQKVSRNSPTTVTVLATDPLLDTGKQTLHGTITIASGGKEPGDPNPTNLVTGTPFSYTFRPIVTVIPAPVVHHPVGPGHLLNNGNGPITIDPGDGGDNSAGTTVTHGSSIIVSVPGYSTNHYVVEYSN